MVTPRSENRKAHVALETEQTESTANTRPGTRRNSSRRQVPADDSSSDEGNPFYQDDDENDATTELAWQIRQLTAMEEMDPTPRVEIAQHRPLGNITPFRDKLDESENSMQWLKGFVYEMKGTHSTQQMVHGLPTESQRWCRTLTQSSISKVEAETRYYRAKWSEKKHIRDYLNRLNGYARSANIKFEHSGRDAKEHVKRFWRHRGLERQLTPMRLRDIHTLEDIVSDIQKVEKRVSNRSSSQSSSRRDDKRHSSSSGNYGRHDSRGRSQERSRSEPRHISRVALVDASVTDLITELQTRASSERPNEYSNDYSNDDPIDFYEAANDNERRNADNGTFARSDKRPQNNGQQSSGFKLGCPPTETGLATTGQPQSADLVIDAECLYLFTGECEWPEDNNNNDENEKM
ncbi:LOW QUALITY PROTEIN: hypothetical protein PHMEG_00032978 [Phytophthora megakarya]|uniref:Retrotransposon gag domain-containing protein n=1 Tax=Phytophthora megakarya TaxID=4795 RepID=A0A225UUR9_9STRA|nr:LOW QUALITY PROTEIN: hypothetical protein PHMEG_00032978 [Phytophthora megakarya]